MRYTVRTSIVEVVGNIWQPGVGLCAYQYTLSPSDVENCRDAEGNITRASVEDWLGSHSGDFQHIIDFHTSLEVGAETLDFPWEEELCKDIGDIPRGMPSYIEIDWEKTADNLKVDYTAVDFDGETYWIR